MNRERVEDALLEMGMRIGLLGFEYITDAILLMPDEYCKDTSMYILYLDIAKKHKTSWTAAERCIRYAFSAVRSDRRFRNAVEHYIGTYNMPNGESLKRLYRALAVEQEGGAAA